MLCYRNGDITRRWVKDKYCRGDDWNDFERCIHSTKWGCFDEKNELKLAFFMTADEITPGITKIDKPIETNIPFKPTRSHSPPSKKTNNQLNGPTNPSPYPRAVIEQRAIAMKTHLKQVAPYLFTSSKSPSRSRSRSRSPNRGGRVSSSNGKGALLLTGTCYRFDHLRN
jgi:hypothetical protein